MYILRYMPVEVINGSVYWDTTITFHTEKDVIIPMTKGCPRRRGASDLYNPQHYELFDHKGKFYRYMIEAGYSIYIPQCYWIKYEIFCMDRMHKILEAQILVLKPVRGSNGDNIKIISSITLPPPSDYVVMEYIDGETEYIGTVFCQDGYIKCSKYVYGCFGKDKYIKNGPILGCIDADYLGEQLNPCFQTITRSIGYNGILCINFKITDAGLKIFEMNPKFGSTMISHNELFNEFLKTLVTVL